MPRPPIRATLLAAVLASGLTTLPSSAAHAQRTTTLSRAEGQRVEIVGVLGDALYGPASEQRLAELLHQCRGALGLSAADSAATIAHRLSAVAPMGDMDHVRFVVLPVERLYVQCGAQAPVLLLPRGIRFALEPTVANGRVTRVEVREGERTLRPARVGSADIALLGAWGVQVATDHAMVIDLPLDALVSSDSGRATRVEFSVWLNDGAEPERIVLPPEALEAFWDVATPLRVARLQGPGAAAAASAVDDLRSSYDRADLAAVLAAGGEATTARAQYERALLERPCLSAAPSAPAAVRALDARAARPFARCEAEPSWRVASRAALLPGFGRRAEGTVRSPARFIPAVIIGATAATGVTLAGSARAKYDDYLRANMEGEPATSTSRLNSLFKSAETRRSNAQLAVGVAVATWLTSIAVDVVGEQRFARRLRADRGRVGLSLSLP